MNKFMKVPFNQYYIHRDERVSADTAKMEFICIKSPVRATSGSCGHDFFAPFSFVLAPKKSILIPTGIAAQLDEDKFLAIFPRSGLGFNYQVGLANTVGIIDSDYIGSRHYGHIMIKLVNNGTKRLDINKGDAFAQGVIMKFYKTDDDGATAKRSGGFGSTDVKA